MDKEKEKKRKRIGRRYRALLGVALVFLISAGVVYATDFPNSLVESASLLVRTGSDADRGQTVTLWVTAVGPANASPTVAEFSSSVDFYPFQSQSVSLVVDDQDGYSEILNVSVPVVIGAETISFLIDNSTDASVSELSDANNRVSSLSLSASVVNSTAINYTLTFKVHVNATQDSSVDTGTVTAFDTAGGSGTGSQAGWFAYYEDVKLTSLSANPGTVAIGGSVTFSFAVRQDHDTSVTPVEDIDWITGKIELAGVEKCSDTSISAGVFSCSATVSSTPGTYNYTAFLVVTSASNTGNQSVLVTVTALASLNLKVVAADGSTLASTLTNTYVSINNGTSYTKLASAGWANFTGVTNNTNVVVTLRGFNSSNSNSALLVNSSNSVTINVTATMNRVLLASIYQSVSWSFKKQDGTVFTPAFFEVTFGNNSTKKNITSTGVFVNGSNTVNRMYWLGGNVKNSSTGFSVSSDAEALVFSGRIYRVSYVFRAADGSAVTPSQISLVAPNGTTIGFAGGYSNWYMQNGTWAPISILWQGSNVRLNVTDTYSPSSDGVTYQFNLRIYSVALQGQGLSDSTLSGVSFTVTFPNATVTGSLSANSSGYRSVGYAGNGTLSITGFWQSVKVNSSFSYALTADISPLNVKLQVGKDSSSNFRFAVGSGKMVLEELVSTYQVEPANVVVNDTTVLAGGGGWVYDSGTHLLTLTNSSFKQSTTIHDYSWNLGSTLLIFNATGSETLFKVSWAGVVVSTPPAAPASGPDGPGGVTLVVTPFTIGMNPTRYTAWIGETTTLNVDVGWTKVTEITVTQVEILGNHSGWVVLLTRLPQPVIYTAGGPKITLALTITVPADAIPETTKLSLKVTAESGGASATQQQPVDVEIRSRSAPSLSLGGGTNLGDYSLYGVAALILLIVGASAFGRSRKNRIRTNPKLSRHDVG
ncbi:MAG: hypothetical protein HYY22_07875 [Thaumarchaeota archaeon]|nr:hypothetical protein [Nitrososphaerota archaeon]